MILSQHQPNLPGEMPVAYLLRTGAPTEREYNHYEDMRDAHIVDQVGVYDRRHAAHRRHHDACEARIRNVRVGDTDEQITVEVFYGVDDDQAEIRAVYEASTWEDVTDLIDHDSLAEQIEIDDDSRGRADIFDARAERMRYERD